MSSPAMNVILTAIDKAADIFTHASLAVIFAFLLFWALMVIADKLGIYSKFDRFMRNTSLGKRREYETFRDLYYEERRQRYPRPVDRAWADYQSYKGGDRDYTPKDYYEERKRNFQSKRDYQQRRERNFSRRRRYR